MLTPAQVRATIAHIRNKEGNENQAYALRAEGSWTGPETLDVGGKAHRVTLCQSDLQMREALLRSEQAKEPCVLLCTFKEEQLGDDVRVRLAKRRLWQPQRSEVLAQLFSARIVDPRVLACRPLVDALIDNAQGDGYSPVPGGSLDALTAWTALLSQLFQENVDSPGLTLLLRWSLDPAKLRTLANLPEDLRKAMVDWMCTTRGRAPRFMADAVVAGIGSDLLPLGLLLGLLFSPSCRGHAESRAALARLEQYFGGHEIDEASAKAWAAASADLLGELRDARTVKALLTNLDQLIQQTKVGALAHHSPFSPLGMQQRFDNLGNLLRQAMDAKAGLGPVQAALSGLGEHFTAREHAARIERARMALRLVAWLADGTEPAPHAGLHDLARHYWSEGGFVDLARNALEESDPAEPLRQAYARILDKVEARNHPREERFARMLQQWCKDGSPKGAALPIERVLSERVVPTARQQPVLLLVLDGMSVPAFQQLLEDLLRHDWVELGHSATGIPGPVIAALPSVTEVSRWALLAGRLASTDRSGEKVEFQNHPELVNLSGASTKPQLFNKGDLSSEGQLGLSNTVRNAITNPRCKVVAVVVNAIDDLLSGGDMLSMSWTLDSIKLLRELLHAATEGERLVLLTSDHGHVLDFGSSQLNTNTRDPGDRWGFPGGQPADGEMEFSGKRVQDATGKASVICLTRPQLRYSSKKRGYHGGATMQEVVVPFAVIQPVGADRPKEWEELPAHQPAWWNLELLTQPEVTAQPAPPPLKPRPPKKPEDQGELFALPQQAPAAPAMPWLESLLGSELYQEQITRAGRSAPQKEQVRALLRNLAERGGSQLGQGLASQLSLPGFRLVGLIQAVARVLNVDGYEVIAYDRSSDTATLNLQLLKSQFGLE